MPTVPAKNRAKFPVKRLSDIEQTPEEQRVCEAFKVLWPKKVKEIATAHAILRACGNKAVPLQVKLGLHSPSLVVSWRSESASVRRVVIRDADGWHHAMLKRSITPAST